MSLGDLVGKSIDYVSSSVKKGIGYASLGAVLAFGGVSCGGTEEAGETGSVCVSNDDCKGARECIDGVCGSGSDEGDRCGNSPLYGKYLWNVGNCEGGAIDPLGEDCTTIFTGDRAEEGMRVKVEVYDSECTYTIDDRKVEFTLARDFPCSEAYVSEIDYNINEMVKTPSPERCELYKCALVVDEFLFVGKNEEGVSLYDNLFKIYTSPWSGTSSCREKAWNETWKTECFVETGP